MGESSRVEHDTMGSVTVPASAYYGAQTQRAFDNFRISGLVFSRRFLRAPSTGPFVCLRSTIRILIEAPSL